MRLRGFSRRLLRSLRLQVVSGKGKSVKGAGKGSVKSKGNACIPRNQVRSSRDPVRLPQSLLEPARVPWSLVQFLDLS